MSNEEMSQIAYFIKAFSNPLRLNIIMELQGREKSVNEIVRDTGAQQSYVSQQLIYLTKKNILLRRTNSHNVYYSVKNRDVFDFIDRIRFSVFAEKSIQN